MKVEFEELTDNARLWIYQSDRVIARDQVDLINEEIDSFVSGWAAHQVPLAASGKVFHDRFIVLMVDEEKNAASGCSIDTSVAFIKHLESTYGLRLFDRMTFSYEKDGVIYTVPKERFKQLYQDGEINENTLVFDNLIKTKSQLSEWKKPLGNSWMKRFVS